MTVSQERWARAVFAVAFGATSALSFAALPVGAVAPDFTTAAALGGQQFKFSLAQSLKKGPVVLYFYPKAFTSGCTLEAHAFAEATAEFNALGATVVGMSVDDITTLQRFSVEACRDKFAVASDVGGRITRGYAASMADGIEMADRISYVISPLGKVISVFSGSNPDEHVKQTMTAVQKWKSARAQ